MPAGDEELAQLTAYLGADLAALTATDAACAEMLNQIDMVGVLKEMRDEGVSIRCCRGGQFETADQMRQILDFARASAEEAEDLLDEDERAA